MAAEIVGLVSAIATLATLGFHIADGISTIANEMKLSTIGAQLQAVAVDTKAFAHVLRELRKHLKHTTSITKSALDIAHEIIAQCQADIQDLDKCVEPFFIKSDDKRTLGWMRRVQWMFAKSKLATRRVALDSLKLTINMFMSTLSFMDGDDMENYMQHEMRDMVARCKNTKGAFLDAERHDRAVANAFSSLGDASGDLLLEGDKEVDTQICKPELGGVDESTTALARASDTGLNDQTLCKGQSINAEDKNARATDFEVIETISDDQLVKIGEHLRIQKITSSFALVALSQGSNTPQDESTLFNQSAFQPANRPIPNHDAAQTATSQSPTSHNAQSPPALEPSAQTEPDERSTTRSTGNAAAESNGMSTIADGSEKEESAQEPPPRRPASSCGNAKTSRGQTGNSRSTRYAYRPQEPFYSPYDQPFPNGEPSMHYYPQQPNYYYPNPFQQGYGHQFPMFPPMASPYPKFPPEAPRQSDPEKLKLEEQIRSLKENQEKEKEAEKQKEMELKIRKEAEEAFHRRMEDMRRAQEEAKREITRAKGEAERMARERVEAEKKAEEERAKIQAQQMKRAEENAMMKFEAEMKRQEERRKQEGLDRQRAEEAARIRLEAAIKAEAEAKAAADRKAFEEVERLKRIEADAKRKAEADAAAKVAREIAEAKAQAEAEFEAEAAAKALRKRIEADVEAKVTTNATRGKIEPGYASSSSGESMESDTEANTFKQSRRGFRRFFR